MKRKNRVILISAVVVMIVIITAIVVQYKKTVKSSSGESHRYIAYSVSQDTNLSLSGKIVSTQIKSLVSPSGNLKQLNVSDGQAVKNGDVLMTVTNQDAQQAVSDQNDVVNKAIRAVNTASDTFKNSQKSYNQANDDSKSAAKDSLTEAQQSYNEANADLTDAKNKLVELQNKVTSNVTAPFDGIVSVDNDTKDGIPALTVTSSEKELKAN